MFGSVLASPSLGTPASAARRSALVLGGLCWLSLAACAGPPGLAGPDSTAAAAKDRAAHEIREGLEAPASELPSRVQRGVPAVAEPLSADLAGVPDDPDCPADPFTRVRSWQGDDCDSYQAEIVAWAGGCVERCDELGMAQVAIHLAMGACSAWCSERSCSRATFVPPPEGCVRHDCYLSSRRCPAEHCPLNEYCTLPGDARVWNCFCRDMIET